MSKNFHYLSYKEKFSKEILANLSKDISKNIVFVFDDFQRKKEFIKESKFIFIDKNYEFLTFDELRDKLYITSKILIDKSVSSIILFGSLTPELKKKLGVTDYFSMKEFSNRFFTFFRELYKNNVESLDSDFIYNWEKSQVQLMYEVKEIFDKTLDKDGYYPKEWIVNMNNFCDVWIKNTEKIIFIDVVKFTNLDKEILEEKLSYINVDFYFQLNINEFDEEKLRIKDVKIPDSIGKIKLYDVIDDTIGAFNLVNFLSKDEKEDVSSMIYSPMSNDNYYSDIFPKFFQRPLKKPVEETKFFEFIEAQKLLLDSLVEINGNIDESNLLFRIDGFLQCFNRGIFKEYYGVSDFVEKSFHKMIEKDYKYISKEILLEHVGEENPLENSLYNTLIRIINDITLIFGAKNYQDVLEFLNKILFRKKYLKKMSILDYKNNDEELLDDKEENLKIPKYFLFYEEGYNNIILALHEIFREVFLLSQREIFEKIIEEKFGIFAYKFLFDEIQNLSYKIEKIEKVEEKKEKKEENLYTIEDINNGRYSKFSNDSMVKKGYFIDMINTVIPSIKKENIIFTENQLMKLGFITNDEKKNIEKYRFIQNISLFDELVFFSYTNDAEKIENSAFIEELNLKYNLKKEELVIHNNEYIKMLEQKFISKNAEETLNKNDTKNKANDITKEDIIDRENINFRKDKSLLKEKLKLGAYTYVQMKTCNLQYYLDNIIGFSQFPIKNKIEPITRLYLGNFFHEIMEKIVESKRDEIIANKNFYVEKEYVEKVIEKIVKRDMGKKIPYYFEKYYLEALIPKLVNNILKFFMNIKVRYEKANIRNIEIEKITPQEKIFMDKNNIEVFLNGKVDLLITTDVEYNIYDHKTGKPKDGQMDFYRIAFFPESNSVKKWIYNGWDGELKEEEEETLTIEEMEVEISRFIVNERLAMVEPNRNGNFPACKECIYKKICGRG